MTLNWQDHFNIKPCSDALAWLENSSFKSLEDAWQACYRSDWMVWALTYRKDGKALTKRQHVELRIALIKKTPLGDGRTVYDLLDDPRIIEAVKVAERYAEGNATDAELSDAASAAYAAYAAYVTTNTAATYFTYKGVFALQANIVRAYWPKW